MKTSQAANAIAVQGISIAFHDVHLFDDVSLTVDLGEIARIDGPNGAGKSTLLRILAGQQRPDVGQVRVLGVSPSEPGFRRQIGYCPSDTVLEPMLTASEHVELVSSLWMRTTEIGSYLNSWRLGTRVDVLVDHLSTGERQMLQIALTMAHDPTVLLLDEPFRGLDTSARSFLADQLLAKADSGKAIVLISHDDRSLPVDKTLVIGEGEAALRA